MEKIIILSVVFFSVSTLFSMIGMGGGIFYVPILLFAGYGMSKAPGISLVLITATSLAALYKFAKSRMVDWKLALVIDPPTDIMAFVGGYFSGLIAETILQSILVGVLIIAGFLMIKKPSISAKPEFSKKHWWIWYRQFGKENYSVNLPLVLTATALIGLLSGMLGITGGIIKLPIMVLLCGVPMQIAVATSTIMVAVTAMSGVAGHAINSQVEWQTALTLAGAAMFGGFLGSHISVSMNKSKLKKLFGVIVLLIALRMFIKLILK